MVCSTRSRIHKVNKMKEWLGRYESLVVLCCGEEDNSALRILSLRFIFPTMTTVIIILIIVMMMIMKIPKQIAVFDRS